MLPWVLAQWEEYHTGNMLYGNGYWGVMEALYATSGVHFVTALFGNELWNLRLAGFLFGRRLSICTQTHCSLLFLLMWVSFFL